MHGSPSVNGSSSSNSSSSGSCNISGTNGLENNKLEIICGDDSDKENSIYSGSRNTDERRLLSNGCGIGKRTDSLSFEEGTFEGCRNCLERFEAAIRKIEPSLGLLPVNNNNNNNGQQLLPATASKKKHRDLTPLQISINVVDPDNNNLNVCMCSIADNDDVDQAVKQPIDSESPSSETNSGNRICTRCRNIINQQPLEHRRALISQRLTLANNIIVNRIDSHFLSTSVNGSGTGRGNGKVVNYEPYTPDSMESHSPMLATGGLDELSISHSPSSSSYNSSTGTDGTRGTMATKSSSMSSCEPLEGIDLNLIEPDKGKVGPNGSNEDKFKSNGRPELQTMNSVEVEVKGTTNGISAIAVGKGTTTNGVVAGGSQGVNANQLKSRLERLQILSKMSKHTIRKPGCWGREEFESKMRRREEKKELKEFRKETKKGKGQGCFNQEKKNGEGESKSKSPCSVM